MCQIIELLNIQVGTSCKYVKYGWQKKFGNLGTNIKIHITQTLGKIINF